MQLRTGKLSLCMLSFIASVSSFQLGAKPAFAGLIDILEFMDRCKQNGGKVTPISLGTSCSDGNGKPVPVGAGSGAIGYFPMNKDEIDVNEKQHDTQGTDPFVGIFKSDIPISSFLNGQSSNLNLSLDINASKIELTGPEIWGEPTLKPNLIDGSISIKRDASSGGFTITDYSVRFDSFLINGISSGINTNTILANKSQLSVNLLTGEINAYSEETITNDLYSGANPILVFSNTQGQIVSDNEIQVTSNNDPMIVPGFPGQLPSYPLGIAYIGTIASFDSNTGLLNFGDNLGDGLTADVSIVSSPDGTYDWNPTSSEALVGASFTIEPSQFLGEDNSGPDLRYLFSDSRFSLFNSDGIFASGILRNISIETYSFNFTGDIVLDENVSFLSSPFIDRWRSNPSLQLIGPLASNALIASTLGFSQNGTSGIDHVNLEPVPEPLTILGSVAALGFGAYAERKRKPSKSSEKDNTKDS